MSEYTKSDPQLLLKIYEQIPLAITVVNRYGKIQMANSAAEKVLRLNKTTIEQRDYDDPSWAITDFDGNPWPSEKLPFTIAQRTLKTVHGIRHAIQHVDNTRSFLNIDAIPLLDDRGEFDGIIAFIDDITETVLASQRHKEHEATLKSIFRAAPVGIGMVKRRVLAWANDRLQEITGYSEDELMGQSARMLYPSQEEFEFVGREKYRQIAIHGTGTVETQWMRKDGRIIEVLLSSTPIDSTDLDKGVTFSAQDISQRKKLEQQLRHSEKMQAIGQLAGGIAHDFNNQLAGIMGFADLLEDELADNPRLRKYTAEILSATTRASELTFQLLAFAQKGKYLSVAVDIHKVIAEVVGLLSHSISKQICIEQHLQANPSTVKGDPSQIQHALLNLAINGRDAMPEGGTLSFHTETVSISNPQTLSSSMPIAVGNYIRIAVSDTGIGISKENRARIFEPFFSTDNETSGLGLAAVYGTCQNHNGAVDVQSEKNNGSTFSIYLPLESTATDNLKAPHDRDSLPENRLQTVLIVDDEEVVREMLLSIIASLGYRALTCNNGEEAIRLYRENPATIDLIVLDMVMPVKDGTAAFTELREINPNAKILVSSGYTVDGDAQNLLAQGALGFIQKPFRRNVIKQKLDSLLKDEK
ncbi:MAG: PAS domain S-box protein [Deltaproteobacteria bacterium]|nr:PAS domain S-box protein [Deltaproteobacteria bacterium]